MFDFTQAIQNALGSANSNEESGNKSYKYKLVYPPKGGVLTVRLLFNPKSNMITRLVQRHEKVACLRTYYGKPHQGEVEKCPICKMQEDVKNSTGMDPFAKTSASKTRGISYAQFVSCTVPIEGVNPGDNVLLMYPWSVYQSIQQMIQATAQSPTGMDLAFCHANQGMFIQITVSNDFKYSCVQVPYMTFSNGMTDDQFLNMLENMESLAEEVLPSQPTEDVMNQVNEYAQGIYKQYLEPKATPTAGVPQNVTPVGFSTPIPQQAAVPNPQPTMPRPVPPTPVVVDVQQSQVPFNPPYNVTTTPATIPTSQPTPAVNQNNFMNLNTQAGVPACYGQHENGAPKCICCPMEVQCMGATK